MTSIPKLEVDPTKSLQALRHVAFLSRQVIRCTARMTGKRAPFILAALTALACSTATPTGPLFSGPVPVEGSTTAYLYRVDAHHSFSTVEIRFDGERSFHILDEEYATIGLEDGIHEVQFRLRNAIWGSWRWRTQVLRTRRGETLYMHISVGVEEQATPSGRDHEVPGRDFGTSGEDVTVRLRDESKALEQLSRTHLIDPAARRPFELPFLHRR